MGNHIIWFAILILVVLQAGFNYYPPMQMLFNTQALPSYTWTMMLVIGASLFILVEIEKIFIRIYLKLYTASGKI